MRTPFDGDAVAAVATLDEPTRRGLYELVAASDGAIGRDAAAAALGISRELAAFHLDRLVSAGLLETEYRRLGARRGPGAGRPAKLYRRTDRDVSVSLPSRDYRRAADVFATALGDLGDRAGLDAVAAVARARGRQVGTAARAKAGRRAGRRRLETALVGLLEESGYEPSTEGAERSVVLRNCPYDALVADHRDMTCGMNLAWGRGVVDGLAAPEWEAVLEPAPGRCCVHFERRDGTTGGR
jgi:predicted ArsR family transcriptional regulator